MGKENEEKELGWPATGIIVGNVPAAEGGNDGYCMGTRSWGGNIGYSIFGGMTDCM